MLTIISELYAAIFLSKREGLSLVNRPLSVLLLSACDLVNNDLMIARFIVSRHLLEVAFH